ncbi:MAG TPA: RNA polymerase sigma factor [Acidimicrobiales bacterium]|nr:RNA polymerase sigma factor [Acidimicrobiales bacterium]
MTVVAEAIVRPFEEVVAEHGAVVLRVCRAMLSPSDADDAWAETFVAALRAYPGLRPDSNVRAWLVTIAYRKAIDQIRATARAPVPTAALPEFATSDHISAPLDTQLRAALQALPAKQQAAVIYHYLADLPYAEVGVLLETSEAAARRSAADGIANLRKNYSRGTQS